MSGSAIGQSSRAGIMTGFLDFLVNKGENARVEPWAKVIQRSGFASDKPGLQAYFSSLMADRALKLMTPEAQHKRYLYQKHGDPVLSRPKYSKPSPKQQRMYESRYIEAQRKTGSLGEDHRAVLEHYRNKLGVDAKVIDKYVEDITGKMKSMVSDPTAGRLTGYEPTGVVVETPDYVHGGNKVKQVKVMGEGDYKTVDPTTTLIKMLEDVQTTTAHNYMMHAIKRMVESPGGNDVGTFISPEKLLDRQKAGTWDPANDKTIEFHHLGRRAAIEFTNNDMGTKVYRSMKYSAPFHIPGKVFEKIIAGPKRMMVLGTTGANLGFLLFTNTIRDTFARAIQTNIKGEGGFKALGAGGKNFGKLWKLTMDLAKDPDAWNKGKWKGNRYAQEYMEYISSGAKGASLVGADISSRRAATDWAHSRAKVLQNPGGRAGENLKFVLTHPV